MQVCTRTLDPVARKCHVSCTFDNKDLRSKITKDILASRCKKMEDIYLQSREVERMASAFADVQTAPPIEVFQLGRDFAADTNPQKVLGF